MRLRTLLQTTLLALALPAAAGCNTIQLRVLEPGAVSVPSRIQTVAIIDRSRVGNAREGLASALEGALTGEEIGVDAHGRSEAIQGLTSTLTQSPRFRVVQPMLDLRERESSLFEDDISFFAAERICRQVQCEGIIALEAFDSDSSLQQTIDTVTSTDEKGHEVRRRVFKAQRNTRTLASWRFYDVYQKTVIDELRDYSTSRSWDAQGDTEDEARLRLPSQRDTVGPLASESGAAYARRIAPSWALVTRKFYPRGDDRMKSAKPFVKAGDWRGASAIWETVAQDADPKLRGKAHFNLALAAEVEGDLPRALDLARKAATELDNGRSASYVATLERRIADQARLQKQLEPPPPPPPPRRQDAPPAPPPPRR